jgi:hypothetical protein
MRFTMPRPGFLVGLCLAILVTSGITWAANKTESTSGAQAVSIYAGVNGQGVPLAGTVGNDGGFTVATTCSVSCEASGTQTVSPADAAVFPISGTVTATPSGTTTVSPADASVWPVSGSLTCTPSGVASVQGQDGGYPVTVHMDNPTANPPPVQAIQGQDGGYPVTCHVDNPTSNPPSVQSVQGQDGGYPLACSIVNSPSVTGTVNAYVEPGADPLVVAGESIDSIVIPPHCWDEDGGTPGCDGGGIGYDAATRKLRTNSSGDLIVEQGPNGATGTPWYVALLDSTGTWFGSRENPVRTDPVGTTIQPTSQVPVLQSTACVHVRWSTDGGAPATLTARQGYRCKAYGDNAGGEKAGCISLGAAPSQTPDAGQLCDDGMPLDDSEVFYFAPAPTADAGAPKLEGLALAAAGLEVVCCPYSNP